VFGPDVLDSGPPGSDGLRGSRARGRRRAVAVAGTVLVVAAAAVLAARSTSDPPPAPVPAGPLAPSSPADRTQAGPAVVSDQVIQTAFGATTAYALLGGCPGGRCAYAVLASTDEGRSWVRLPTPLPPPRGNDGFSAELRVTGDDDLAVLDPLHQRLFASTDRGRTFVTRVMGAGPAVDAVPPGLRAEQTRCASEACGPARVVVLDPATGRTSPLRAQPLPRSGHLEVATGDDGRIWVAGLDGDRLVSAVSGDRGRTWRALPPLAGLPLRLVRLVPVPGGGGAYLLTGRQDAQDVLNAFSELWRADGADPRWVGVTPPGKPASALSVVGLSDGELLLTEEGGGAWRTSGGGTRIAREPDPTVDDFALPLERLERAGPLLVARPSTGDAVLLVSADDGRSWERRPITGR
jgi:hypothetical protein